MNTIIKKLITKKTKIGEKISKLENKKELCVDNQFKIEDEIFEAKSIREHNKAERKLQKEIDKDFELADKIEELYKEYKRIKRQINYQIKKGIK